MVETRDLFVAVGVAIAGLLVASRATADRQQESIVRRILNMGIPDGPLIDTPDTGPVGENVENAVDAYVAWSTGNLQTVIDTATGAQSAGENLVDEQVTVVVDAGEDVAQSGENIVTGTTDDVVQTGEDLIDDVTSMGDLF